jgi:hypothetical protein
VFRPGHPETTIFLPGNALKSRVFSPIRPAPFSFSAHALHLHLAPDNPVGGFAADHFEAGKFRAAGRALHVAFGPVFRNAVKEAFDKATRPIFGILVEQAAALQAADGDGSEIVSQCRCLSCTGSCRLF